MKTYKYRIYPTIIQIGKLEKTLNTCRFLYNDSLADRKNAYERTGKTINYYDQAGELKNRDMSNVYQQVQQDTLRRLDKAMQAFFRRIKSGDTPGYPRFQGYDRFNSFTYPQSGFKILENGKLRLSKIGDLKIKLSRLIEGKIKTCTVIRDGGQWYVSIVTDLHKDAVPIEIKSAVGIDVGIKTLATLSNGDQIPNIRTTNKYESRLAKVQRRLSRMKKGSKNRNKQKVKLQNIHRTIRNVRQDYLHKESRKLVNQWDLIVLEDLQIGNMLKNHRLAKSIADVSWSAFTSMLTYKAEWAGKETVFVNPRNTSKSCSSCGSIQDMPLSKRTYNCPVCGLVLDRDHNAAINILHRVGSTQMSTPVETFVRESMNQESPSSMLIRA